MKLIQEILKEYDVSINSDEEKELGLAIEKAKRVNKGNNQYWTDFDWGNVVEKFLERKGYKFQHLITKHKASDRYGMIAKKVVAGLLDESSLRNGLPGHPREDGFPGPFGREVLFNKIRPRDMVTIVTPHGSKLKGRAVMRGPAGWVLNLGGRYGTPGIATEENVIGVRG